MSRNPNEARYKKVLSLRKQKFTFEEIGRLLGITRQRAHQIYKAAMSA